MFDFKPMDVPEGELKPVERAFLNGIRNLELAIVKISTVWLTALLLIGLFWGVGGYIFYAKIDEYSSSIKTTTQMEVELKYIKEKIERIERGK